jgi:hypothetical protein
VAYNTGTIIMAVLLVGLVAVMLFTSLPTVNTGTQPGQQHDIEMSATVAEPGHTDIQMTANVTNALSNKGG